jgi:hypothetical protein
LETSETLRMNVSCHSFGHETTVSMGEKWSLQMTLRSFPITLEYTRTDPGANNPHRMFSQTVHILPTPCTLFLFPGKVIPVLPGWPWLKTSQILQPDILLFWILTFSPIPLLLRYNLYNQNVTL